MIFAIVSFTPAEVWQTSQKPEAPLEPTIVPAPTHIIFSQARLARIAQIQQNFEGSLWNQVKPTPTSWPDLALHLRPLLLAPEAYIFAIGLAIFAIGLKQ